MLTANQQMTQQSQTHLPYFHIIRFCIKGLHDRVDTIGPSNQICILVHFADVKDCFQCTLHHGRRLPSIYEAKINQQRRCPTLGQKRNALFILRQRNDNQKELRYDVRGIWRLCKVQNGIQSPIDSASGSQMAIVVYHGCKDHTCLPNDRGISKMNPNNVAHVRTRTNLFNQFVHRTLLEGLTTQQCIEKGYHGLNHGTVMEVLLQAHEKHVHQVWH
mmetsp:Transcript_112586/g.195546  ORF Transcript_112586/g.195546 Transcript_112586/m.195546 type:complete len:217 (-) Transcript_112586:291-941(-)